MKQLPILTTIIAFVLLLAFPADGRGQDSGNGAEWRAFLDNLSGEWTLTGTMGSRALHQRCEGRWVLRDQFFQMDCEAVPPDSSGYRARYIIGYHSEKERYVFHLFDTFGGSYSETLGRGRREGDRISFLFDYPEGAFQNVFAWDGESGSWTMILRRQNEKGRWELFSEKTLTRTNR